jgi:hypothetical protein
MKTYTADELKEVIRLHALWLADSDGGIHADLSRADLSDAYLTGANLIGANLSWADLRGADLSDAYLNGADLRGANLSDANLRDADLSRANLSGAYLNGANLSDAYLNGADLRGADLRRANLSDANLRDADLSWADLSDAYLNGADLRGADLSGANLIGANLNGAYLSGAKGADLALAIRMHIPPTGPFWAWKKCHSVSGDVIVKLLVPEDARRSHGAERKCRAEFVNVLEVIGAEEGHSDHTPRTIYRAGQRVTADSWDDNRWDTCSHGISFFLTKEEAEAYNL